MTNQTLPPQTNLQKNNSFGQRLKSCREALGIDIKEVALQLRLPEKIIIMLEQGELPDLPVTFIRGYIRNYSKFLSIPEEEVKEALESFCPQIEIKKTESALEAEEKITSESSLITARFATTTLSNFLMQLLTYVIGITLIVLVGIWWYSHKNTAPQNLSVPETSQSQNIKSSSPSTQITNKVGNITPPQTPITNQTSTFKKSKNNFLQFISHFFNRDMLLIKLILIGSILGLFGYLYFLFSSSKTSDRHRYANRKIRKSQANLFIKSKFTIIPDFILDLMSYLKSKNTLLILVIVVFSLIGVNTWRNYKKHHQFNYHRPVVVSKKIKPLPNQSLDDTSKINLFADLEILAPSSQLNKKLASAYKTYFLTRLNNKLNAYLEQAEAIRFELTDPSTPYGEFIYIKKPRRYRRRFRMSESETDYQVDHQKITPYYQNTTPST